jgi:hypothetical protein
MMQMEVDMLNAKNIQRALLVAATLTLFPPSATWSDGTSDASEISGFKLTEAGLAKYLQATSNLGSLAQQLPGNCDEDEDDSESDDAGSIDDTVARFNALPGVKAAIQSAGMTTREYVVFTWSIFQSALAAWALDQPGGKLPADVSMDNVTFYRQHEAALAKLRESSRDAGCNEDDREDENQEPEDPAE